MRRLSPRVWFARVLDANTDRSLELDRPSLAQAYGLWCPLDGAVTFKRGAEKRRGTPNSVVVTDPGWTVHLAPGAQIQWIAFDLFVRPDGDPTSRRLESSTSQPRFTDLVPGTTAAIPSTLTASGRHVADSVLNHYWIDEQSSWESEAILLRWMTDLFASWRTPGDKRLRAIGDEDLLLRSEEYMRSRAHHGVTVAEVAESIGLSRDRFTILFKRRHGFTAGQFIDQLQLERACSLLRSTDASTTEIAARSGFRSASSLYRRFKTVFGCTPKAWRRHERLA